MKEVAKSKSEFVSSKETKQIESMLSPVLESVPESKKLMAQTLIPRMAFHIVMIKKLEEIIKAEGVVDHYQNGNNQFGTKKSPYVDAHQKYTQLYNATVKQLNDLMPKNEELKVPEKDELVSFLENAS